MCEKTQLLNTFEYATEKLGHGKFHYFILFVCGLCSLSAVTEGINMGLALPFAKCHMKMSIGEQGLLNSAGFMGLLISSHLWGLLGDTWGRRRVLQISSIFSFLFTTISSLSINVWMLFVTRLLVGFFISGLQSASLSYLGEFHSNRTRKRALTIAAMCTTLAILYVGLMSWLIIPWSISFKLFGILNVTSWRIFIFSTSLTNLIVFITISILPESPKFLLAIGKYDQAMNVLKNIYYQNTGDLPENYPVKNIEIDDCSTNLTKTNNFKSFINLTAKQTLPLFKHPHLWNTIMLCFLMFTLYLVAHGTFMWFPDILTSMTMNTNKTLTICEVINDYNLTESKTSEDILIHYCTNNTTNVLIFKIISIIGLILISINGLLLYLLQHMQHHALLIIIVTLASCAGIGLIWANHFYVIILLEMIFLSAGNCGAVLSAIIADLYPTSIKTMALSLILMIGRCGAVAGSNIVGSIINTKCNFLFIFCGILLFCCLIVIVIMMKRKKSTNRL